MSSALFSLTFSEQTFLHCLSVSDAWLGAAIGRRSPGTDSMSSLHYCAPQCCCLDAYRRFVLASLSPTSVLRLYFVHMGTAAVLHPAVEPGDFHICA